MVIRNLFFLKIYLLCAIFFCAAAQAQTKLAVGSSMEDMEGAYVAIDDDYSLEGQR